MQFYKAKLKALRAAVTQVLFHLFASSQVPLEAPHKLKLYCLGCGQSNCQILMIHTNLSEVQSMQLEVGTYTVEGKKSI